MLLDAVRWINPAGGDWSVAANWDAGRVPGAGDDAIVDLSGITVTHSRGTDAVQSLTIAHGTFTLSGGVLDLMNSTFHTNNRLNLIGGTLNHAMVNGRVTLLGGTIANSVITGSVIGTTDGGTLSGVTLNGDLDLTASAIWRCGQQSCAYAIGLMSITDGLTLNGTARIGGTGALAYDVLGFSGTQTLGGDGRIIFGSLPPTTVGSQYFNNYLSEGGNQTLTIGSTIAVDGTYGVIGAGALVNQGTITADAPGGRISVFLGIGRNTGTLKAQGGDLVAIGDAWTNPGGMLTAASGTLCLIGLNNSGRSLSLTVPAGGTLRVNGHGLNNTNGVFTTTAAVGGIVIIDGTVTNTSGTVNLSGAGVFELAGRIDGGTLAETDGAILTADTAGPSELRGVTLDGDLDLTKHATRFCFQQTCSYLTSTVYVTGGLTLNGTVRVGGTGHLAYGTMFFMDTGTLNGNGRIIFGPLHPRTVGFQSFSNTLRGGTLTIGSGIIIDGKNGVINVVSGARLVNQGTINADARGGTISISGFWTNNGIVEAENGGTLSTATPTNYFGGTLTGGTWQVYDNSTLRISMSAGLVANAATVLLDGPNSHFYRDTSGTADALAALTTNTRSLTLQNGAALTTPGDFRNAGSLTIDAGSGLMVAGAFTNSGSVNLSGTLMLTANGGYTQTAGSIILNGGVLTAATVDLQGGILAGSGTITGDVTNAAEIDVGGVGAIGQLAVVGNYTQTAPGILNLEIGGYGAGTGFDQLTISGQAALDGTLNVSLLDGFVPASGDAFALLTFASATGTFAGGTIDAAFGPALYDPMDVTLVAY